jgi:hypothetical protein
MMSEGSLAKPQRRKGVAQVCTSANLGELCAFARAARITFLNGRGTTDGGLQIGLDNLQSTI